MVGTGSGRWTYHNKKLTVEGCWAIGISDVARVVDLSKPGPAFGSLRPNKLATGKRMSPVRCMLKVGDDDKPLLRLIYAVEGIPDVDPVLEEVVRLQTTRPHFSGVRWWFSCPHLVNGKECSRRVGKLYCPPEGQNFACRHCLDLTYESCQESHTFDRLLNLMTAGAPDEETAKMGKAAFKALISQTKIEARKPREHTKSLLEAFDEFFGEG